MKTQVSNLKAGLQDVVSILDALRQGNKLNRQHVVSVLVQPSELLVEPAKALKSNTYKSYPDVIQLRDSVRSTMTVTLNLSELVAAKKIRPRELMEKLGEIVKSFEADIKLADSCIEYLPKSTKTMTLDDLSTAVEGKEGKERWDALQDAQRRLYDQEANARASRREEREDAATAKTSRVLTRLKETYAHKIPKSFTKSIQIIQLPVMARFGTLAMSPESLSSMGFKIQTAGLHSAPSSDLGIVFEHQLLLFFRISDARAEAEDSVRLSKLRDGALSERKEIQKKRNAERRELKKLNELLEAQTIMTRRRAIRDQIVESEETIADFDEHLAAMDSRVKASNSNMRVLRQMKTSDDHAMLNYLTPIIDSINEKSSSTLGLFTTRPLKGVMADADVYCAWLMEKSAIQQLLWRTNNDMKLQNWFLPWTNG